jgi:hypothetical protein
MGKRILVVLCVAALCTLLFAATASAGQLHGDVSYEGTPTLDVWVYWTIDGNDGYISPGIKAQFSSGSSSTVVVKWVQDGVDHVLSTKTVTSSAWTWWTPSPGRYDPFQGWRVYAKWGSHPWQQACYIPAY